MRITSFVHDLTVTVEETGGQGGVGATAIWTTFVLIKIRCCRASPHVGRGAKSGAFLGEIPALVNSYKKSQVILAFSNNYLI